MAYTTNPNIAKVRMATVTMVRRGASTREAARHYGFDHSSVVRWVQRAEREHIKGSSTLPTLSSRPHSHPRQLNPEVVAAILDHRTRYHRCAQVIQADLAEAGLGVSLSSVKRTLTRHGLTPSRKWKHPWRTHVLRPLALSPGDLVQADTIHFIRYREQTRYYVYTAIDLYSRLAHACFVERFSQRSSLSFILAAQTVTQIPFKVVQTDNGPEFGTWFRDMLKAKDITLRHSRVHKPNDNAHIERFNRTIQDECLGRHPKPELIPAMLTEYLTYYNTKRRHLGIDLKTPAEMVQRS